jgi:hypothetical protein
MSVNIGNQLSYISETSKDLSKEFTRFALINAEKGIKERENRKQDRELSNPHKIMTDFFFRYLSIN